MLILYNPFADITAIRAWPGRIHRFTSWRSAARLCHTGRGAITALVAQRDPEPDEFLSDLHALWAARYRGELVLSPLGAEDPGLGKSEIP
jgi:hypothetical protein